MDVPSSLVKLRAVFEKNLVAVAAGGGLLTTLKEIRCLLKWLLQELCVGER